ncbi:MAG: PAS domain S-box protein [Pyrinomonadaceae bacterium]|nr:PAS domain S-box protein [Pyrinomonadaceae bacterium]
MKGKVLTIWSLIWLLATVFFVVGGALNLSQRANGKFPPTDGIVWVQKADGIYAEKVKPELAGGRAGIIPGDKLIAISLDGNDFDEVVAPSDIQMYLEQAGLEGNLTYYYQRTSYSFKDNFYYADLHKIDTLPRWTASVAFLSIVGLIWLGIGMFVLFKQGSNAPFVVHFATLCLTAFVFHVYKPIGIGEDLDLGIMIMDDLAFIFFAPVFLHFCWRYPTRNDVFGENRWKTVSLYLPALVIFLATMACYISFQAEFMTAWAQLIDKYNILGNFYRAAQVHFYLGIGIGAGILIWRFATNKQTLIRQRLKWTVWGTVAAVLPIVAFQIAKRFTNLPEDIYSTALTTLPLALIPMSFGYSVVRYRLMDVDVVVRRVLVYALTTIAIAMLIGAIALGFVFLIIGAEFNATNIVRGLIAIVAMSAIILLSEPLKNFLQEQADRFFYGERYDKRRGLLDFGRTLSATTSLEPLLNSLVNRLQEVLAVEKVAVFIERQRKPGEYRIAKSVGLSSEYVVPSDFRQMIREKSAQTGMVRADEFEISEHETSDGSFVRQELHYFVPCVVRGKMVAVIGLGRGVDGSLLSTEDLEILQTVSGYVAVAVENSLLYEEQAKRTDELALLKEFNESIVESVNVGLLAVDADGRVTRCNSTFEEMLELSREQVVGALVIDLFDENFSANLLQILGKSRWYLQELRHGYKLHTVSSSGKPLILNVAVAPLRIASQSQTGAIIVMENVTARVKLEETLQQSEKLSSIGLLAAGVAHEVNTPLTGVSSYTQMLLGMIPETDPKHALLLKVQKQTERASNIAGNLLNFSRVGNTTEFDELDINKTLDNTLQLLEIQLRKSSIKVVKNYSDKSLKIYGNGGKLQQVFTNLILNARDAIFNGGTITLTTKIENDDSVIIEVKDDGVGIEAENLSKIFDPFFTTKGVGSGTGLGLAVTYGIVQEHSGTIEPFSEVGNGTTFRLEFPLAQKRRKRAVS